VKNKLFARGRVRGLRQDVRLNRLLEDMRPSGHGQTNRLSLRLSSGNAIQKLTVFVSQKPICITDPPASHSGSRAARSCKQIRSRNSARFYRPWTQAFWTEQNLRTSLSFASNSTGKAHTVPWTKILLLPFSKWFSKGGLLMNA